MADSRLLAWTRLARRMGREFTSFHVILLAILMFSYLTSGRVQQHRDNAQQSLKPELATKEVVHHHEDQQEHETTADYHQKHEGGVKFRKYNS